MMNRPALLTDFNASVNVTFVSVIFPKVRRIAWLILMSMAVVVVGFAGRAVFGRQR